MGNGGMALMPSLGGDLGKGQNQLNQINVEFQNGGSSKMFRKMGTMERIQFNGVLREKDQKFENAQQ